MENSILKSVKKTLGLADDYTVYDLDVLIHINSVFSTLNQLGIGPEVGFMIEDASATWDSFLGGDKRLNNVRTYVYLRVRLLFDPPTTGYLTDAVNKQILELEWRMNTYREETQWVDPNPPVLPEDDENLVLDGGES